MEKAKNTSRMEIFMKVNTSMANLMGRDNIFGRTKVCTVVNFVVDLDMDLDSGRKIRIYKYLSIKRTLILNSLWVRSLFILIVTKGTTSMIKNVVLEYFAGHQDVFTMENISTT